MLAASTFVYTEIFYERPEISNETEFEKLKNESSKVRIPKSFKLKKMIINLDSPTRRLRFLEIEMQFITHKKDQTELLETNIAIIQDSIIEVVTRMKPHELNSIAGKILLEERIKGKVNHILKKRILKEIYFTRFVVQ